MNKITLGEGRNARATFVLAVRHKEGEGISPCFFTIVDIYIYLRYNLNS